MRHTISSTGRRTSSIGVPGSGLYYTKSHAKPGNKPQLTSSQDYVDPFKAVSYTHLMETKDRLQNGRGNAMLIAGNIYEACKYYELFQAAGFKKCAIVTSYNPNISDIKGEATGEDKVTENVEKYRICLLYTSRCV